MAAFATQQVAVGVPVLPGFDAKKVRARSFRAARPIMQPAKRFLLLILVSTSTAAAPLPAAVTAPLPATLIMPEVTSGCSWWDPLGICHNAEAAIDRAIDDIKGLTTDVKNAAKEVVDDFFNKLGGVMEKFEAAVLRIEKQSMDDAKALIKKVTDAIKVTTDHIVSKLEELVGQSVAVVKAALEAIISDVSHLVDSIFSHVTDALRDFESFLWHSLCAGEGIVKQIELFITGGSMTTNKDDCECVHDAAVWALDTCASGCTCKGGIFHPFTCPCSVASWASVEDQNAYYAIRCKTLKEIEHGIVLNKTAAWVAAKLGSVSDLAFQLHCYHFSTEAIGNWYADAALALSKDADIWVPPKPDTIRQLVSPPLSHTNEMLAKLVATVEQQGDTIRRQQAQIDQLLQTVTSTASSKEQHNNGCTTAFECWTEALQRLQTAEQLVDSALNKTAMAEKDWESARATFALNASVGKALTALSGSILANKQLAMSNMGKVDNVTTSEATLETSVSTLQATLDGLSKKVDGLKVGLCECQDDAYGHTPGDGRIIVANKGYCENVCDNWAAVGSDIGSPQTSSCKPCLGDGDGSFALLSMEVKRCDQRATTCAAAKKVSTVVELLP